MDIYKINFTVGELELLAYLSLHAGEKLSQREAAKALKVSPTAVANAVKTLTAQNLLNLEPTKTINFISYNRDDPKAIMLKKIENQKQLLASGLAEHLEEQLAGATAVLFGSYAKGEDTTKSDIDIAIIGRKPKTLQLQPFEKQLLRSINLNYYNSWTEIHKHLRNNILNGIVLFGGVDL
jgi:predicted nucleotidyltransferase